MIALFLRHSCVILALSRCYSGFILLVIPTAPPPSAHVASFVRRSSVLADGASGSAAEEAREERVGQTPAGGLLGRKGDAERW